MKTNIEKRITIICDILVLIIVVLFFKTVLIVSNLEKDIINEQKKLKVVIIEQQKIINNIKEQKKIKPIIVKEQTTVPIIPVIIKPTYFINVSNGQITKESLMSICKFIGPTYSISPELLYAMCEKESTRFVNARNGSCKGLMQINEKFHKSRMQSLNISNIYDPYGNILLAADFMNELKKEKNNVYYNLMRYNMATTTANKLFANGQISNYALSIVSHSKVLEKENGGL